MEVSAERGPRGVWIIIVERWISRYQPPSGCGSSPSREMSSLAFVGIGRRNLRQIATWVTGEWARRLSAWMRTGASRRVPGSTWGRPPMRGLSFEHDAQKQDPDRPRRVGGRAGGGA